MILNRAICLTSDSIMEAIVVQQYDKDSRTVQLTVYETPGVLYDLTEKSADVLYRVNGVNTPAYEAKVIGENTLEFTIPGAIAKTEGNCVAQVRFYQGEELLHSQLIPMAVRFSLTDGSGGEEDPTPLFVELLREARDAISKADAATANATDAANEANAAAEGLEEAKSAALNAASEAASETAAARQAAVYATDAGTAAGEAKVDASKAAQAAIAAAEAAATQANLAFGATEEAINATTATRGATEEAGRQAVNAMNAAKTANDAANTANTAANNADVQAESAANATMRALTAAGKPPIVNAATGNWRIWDDLSQAYKETNHPARGQKGDPGFTPTIDASREDDGVRLIITNQTNTQNVKLMDGEDGKSDMNIEDGIAEGSVKIAGSKDEAEGYPIGKYATSFAFDGTAGGDYSHTEGRSTRSAGLAAHAEGNGSTASGDYSHAENEGTASAKNSHAENKAAAEAENSHAEGLGTVARSMNQHVQGRYNVIDGNDENAHIVGNGTSVNDRKNAHTIDWDGNAWFAGNVYSGEDKTEGNRLVRKGELATSGGGMVGSGVPYQHFVTDINGDAKWEDREFYAAGGHRALMGSADLGTIGTSYTQIDASLLKELPEAGKSYVVVWQGKEYKVEPYAMTSGTLWIPMSGANANIPFHFTINHNNGEITKVWVKAYESTDNVVCGIYEEMPESVKCIDPKFLMSGGNAHQMLVTDENGNAKWEDRTHWSHTEESLVVEETNVTGLKPYVTEGSSYVQASALKVITPKVGEKYAVYWNGVRYAVVATGNNEKSVYLNQTPSAEVPFSIEREYVNAKEVWVQSYSETEATVAVALLGEETVKKLDKKYLPESTGGSGLPETNQPNMMLVTDATGKTTWAERTHYPTTGRTVILPELDYSTLDYVDNSLSQDITPYMQGQIVVGETYYLTFGDEVLECRAYADEFGDVYLAENNDFISSRVGILLRDGQYLLSVNAGGGITNTTIKIEGPGIAYKKLDPRYLPEGGVGWTEGGGEITVFDVSFTEEEINSAEDGLYVTTPLGAPIELEKNYTVFWQGEEYPCVGREFAPGEGMPSYTVLGNLDAMMGVGDTGEPFVLMGAPADFQEMGIYAAINPLAEITSFPLTIKVTTSEEVIHKIDPKYLPEQTTDVKGKQVVITIEGSLDGTNTITPDCDFAEIADLSCDELEKAITVQVGDQTLSVYGMMKREITGYKGIQFMFCPYQDSRIEGLSTYKLIWAKHDSSWVDTLILDSFKQPTQGYGSNWFWGNNSDGQWRGLNVSQVKSKLGMSDTNITLKSPDGTSYKIAVDNNGNLTATKQ